MERTLKRTPENNGEGYPPTPHPGNGHQTNEKGKTVPLSQAERDKKRLAELKKSGGGERLVETSPARGRRLKLSRQIPRHGQRKTHGLPSHGREQPGVIALAQ